MKKETIKKVIKKRHIHDWNLAQESCFECGSYSEFCRKKGCYITRFLNSKGVVMGIEGF